jgi:hypothetical protein
MVIENDANQIRLYKHKSNKISALGKIYSFDCEYENYLSSRCVTRNCKDRPHVIREENIFIVFGAHVCEINESDMRIKRLKYIPYV